MMAKGLFTAGSLYTRTQEIMMAKGLFSAGTSITQDLNHDGQKPVSSKNLDPIQLESCLGKKKCRRSFTSIQMLHTHLCII